MRTNANGKIYSCSFLFAFLLSFSCTGSHQASPPSDTFLFGGCTQQKYVPGSNYHSNLNSLLSSLLNSATYSSYNSFTVLGLSPQDVVYGLYQCRGDLSMPDCATCVAHAVTRAGKLCSTTCGGAVQLEGCYVKYDNDSFIGVEDKTVAMEKCGPLDGYATGSMGQRDAVLASLESEGGPYRVGRSGEAQSLAQCVGDLSPGKCQDCLSEAIGRLKTECGTAVFGDMFLAKCYVRYSTSGAGEGKSTDEGSRTLAILVGLLAVLAFLIIFVAFARKVSEGNAVTEATTTRIKYYGNDGSGEYGGSNNDREYEGNNNNTEYEGNNNVPEVIEGGGEDADGSDDNNDDDDDDSDDDDSDDNNHNGDDDNDDNGDESDDDDGGESDDDGGESDDDDGESDDDGGESDDNGDDGNDEGDDHDV